MGTLILVIAALVVLLSWAYRNQLGIIIGLLGVLGSFWAMSVGL